MMFNREERQDWNRLNLRWTMTISHTCLVLSSLCDMQEDSDETCNTAKLTHDMRHADVPPACSPAQIICSDARTPEGEDPSLTLIILRANGIFQRPIPAGVANPR